MSHTHTQIKKKLPDNSIIWSMTIKPDKMLVKNEKSQQNF